MPKAPNPSPYSIFRCRFWGELWYQNLFFSDSIFGLETNELRERILIDFGNVLGGPTLTMLCIYKQNRRFFIFELFGFRGIVWHRKAFKITSKWSPKPFQNEVRNEVWNRGGFDMRVRIDFPGFKEASWRLLGSQWEGKREGLATQTYPNTPLPLGRGGGSKTLRACRRPCNSYCWYTGFSFEDWSFQFWMFDIAFWKIYVWESFRVFWDSANHLGRFGLSNSTI